MTHLLNLHGRNPTNHLKRCASQPLPDFVGQDSMRERLDALHASGEAAQMKRLGHCLLHGPPGLGKTTLATIICKTMGTQLVVTSGSVIDKPGDLAGILTNLKEGDVLFIDEIHRMNRAVEEYLYSAMEDFTLDLMIDSVPSRSQRAGCLSVSRGSAPRHGRATALALRTHIQARLLTLLIHWRRSFALGKFSIPHFSKTQPSLLRNLRCTAHLTTCPPALRSD